MTHISYFPSGITNTTPAKNINFRDLINIVREDPNIQRSCLKIRELQQLITTTTDIEQKKQLKNQKDSIKKYELPFFTPAGTFSARNQEGIIESSGIIGLDLDSYDLTEDRYEQITNKLRSDRYIIGFFRSPSGGLKIFVKTTPHTNPREFTANYQRVLAYYNLMLGITLDENNKDISRACLLSHDAKPYYNEKAEAVIIKEPTKKDTPTGATNQRTKSKVIRKELCPFHADSNASMNVYEDGSFFCFGCGKHGKVDEKGGFTNRYITEGLQLPQGSRTITDLAIDVGKYFVETRELYNQTFNVFYHPLLNEVVEVAEHFDKIQNKTYTQFQTFDNKRLTNLLDKNIRFWKINKDNKNVDSPIAQSHTSLLLASNDFIQSLPKVQRFYKYPQLLLRNNKLHIPSAGYNEDYDAYFTPDTAKHQRISSDTAKKALNHILEGFCFEEPTDKTMALAFLITPACRGVYKRITNRTPLFMIKANRERAGKDYLAGIRSIIYEGTTYEGTPISTDAKMYGGDDELRKKLFTMLLAGRKLFHSSNNRGELRSAVFEQFLTSENQEDRLLGKNETKTIPNELDYSISANMGLTYTADLWARSRPINLFYSEEDANSREFPIPDLHGYVTEHRDKIINCINSLILDWVDAGMPSGNTPFTSYPEWARVVGGIMRHHELGDPCIPLKDDAVGGDEENQTMKEVYTVIALQQYMTNILVCPVLGIDVKERSRGFTTGDIIKYCARAQEEEDILGGYDFEKQGDKIRLSKLIRRYKGRMLTIPDPHNDNQTTPYMLKITRDHEINKRTKYGVSK